MTLCWHSVPNISTFASPSSVPALNNYSVNHVHRKRFRDGNRYLHMTHAQIEAYLPRNREFKWAKRENHASSGSAQSITGQRNMSCSDHIHMLMNFLMWQKVLHGLFSG